MSAWIEIRKDISFHYSGWYVRDGYANLLAAKRFGLEQVVVQYSLHFHFTNEDLHEGDYMNKNGDRHDNTPE
ncbi:hypothetical protein [Paenibacillus polymyxa]|uniref:hypothetical protein n=1 Tax=Paenibacillus polymyxa TaxID=1406 RepID=UPI0023795823|nr:hypothetical protein [Paenibacillus polymyxa]WDM23959.1 hypothetical protein J4I02_10935 [Paenibacillus polymyxa]